MKILSRLGATMMAAIACIGFASCGDDNNEPDKPQTPDVWASSYDVKFELSEDLMNTADITAHIANPDGTFSTETVTDSRPEWTLKGNKLPDRAGVLLTFVPKKNIDENKVYNIRIKGGISATSFRNGEVVNFKGHSGNSGISIKGDKVTQYFVGAGTGFAYGVDADGSIVDVSVLDFDFGLNGLWEWVSGWLSDDKE